MWWDRRGRLEWELRALDAANYEYAVISGDVDHASELHLRIGYPLEGHVIPLEVYYPVLYPFFRFHIDAPELDLLHHQNPFQRNLCLIGRGTDQWSRKYSLADFLVEQVPRVVRAGREQDPSQVQELEQIQAEPFSNYYPYNPNFLLGIDGAWDVDADVQGGTMKLGFLAEPPGLPIVGFVLELRDPGDRLVCSADQRIVDSCKSTRVGHWIRLSEPIRESNPRSFVDTVGPALADLGAIPWQGAKGGSFKLMATIFPEEREWRDGGTGVGWVAALDWRPTRNRSLDGGRGRRPANEAFLVRVSRCGPTDFRARVPAAEFLFRQKIAVVGLGCVGAPIAHSLAQAGAGQLFLLDSDFVDPPTTVRWPLGFPAYGRNKVDTLAGFLQHNYPFSQVSGSTLPIGSIWREQESIEWEVLEAMADGTSLIIDATAEHGVQRFLSEFARYRSIPYVWVWGTRGGWGGLVGRVTAEEDACWACIETAYQNGELGSISEDPAAVLQPAGCGDPTFTGAGFDMHTLSLAAVRVGVSVLSPAEVERPQRDWNVELINFRNEEGEPIPPSWTTTDVPRRPDCPVCGDG